MTLIIESDIEKTMAPDLRVIRGVIFFSRTFLGDILKFLEKYGGYGIKDLYAASVVEQAKMVLSNLRG